MLRSEARYALSLRALPPRVAWFILRARLLAYRLDDTFTLASATRPRDLATLLELARGRARVVELGTATGWTAAALALADSRRAVTTYDPFDRPELHRYLELAGADSRSRIDFRQAPGAAGPAETNDVELLYIDSSHEREETIAEVNAWRPALAPGAVIVFDDYEHPEYPGVREAISDLGLGGEQRGTLFVCYQ